jgi:RNA polymerase-binding transcription factor DksA
MTRNHRQIQQRLQLERQILSAQIQAWMARGGNNPVSAVDIQIRSRQQVKLDTIERALSRLEKGTFGVCQSCGEAIDGERLDSLPYAEQCIECQRKLERKTIRPYAYSTHAYHTRSN